MLVPQTLPSPSPALWRLRRSSAVFLPHTPGVVNDIEAQVRNGFMQGNAAAGSPIAPTMQR